METIFQLLILLGKSGSWQVGWVRWILRLKLVLFVRNEPGVTELPVLAAVPVSFEKWNWRDCWLGLVLPNGVVC